MYFSRQRPASAQETHTSSGQLARRVGWVAGALVALAASACGLDDFEQELVDEASIPAKSQSGPLGLSYGSGFNGVDLSKSKNFDNKGVSPKDVDAIFLKSVKIEGIKPSGPAQPKLDLLLASVELWVQADGLARKVVASGSQFPEGSYTVNLEVVSDVNLKDYAVAPKMTLGTEVTIKNQPVLETTLRTTITLLVDVNLPVL